MKHVSEVLREVLDTSLNEYNEKLVLIKWIFDKYKYLGIEEKHMKRYGMDYYGRTFDYLYDQTLEELSELDRKLFAIAQDYARFTQTQGKGEGHE